jgi:phosphate transport system permease protein
MTNKPSYTGRHRERVTRRSVLIADKVAKLLISFGGFGTIISVGLVFVFLAVVVVPLFKNAAIEQRGAIEASWPENGTTPVHMAVDEYQVLSWLYFPDGVIDVLRLDNGRVLDRLTPFPDGAPTAHVFEPRLGQAAFGFADGAVRLGTIGFGTAFPEPDTLPAEIKALDPGSMADHLGGIVQVTPEGQFRTQQLTVEIGEPFYFDDPAAILLMDQSVRPSGPTIAAYTADGHLRIQRVTQRRNLLTGKTTTTLTGGNIAVPIPPGKGAPAWLRLSGIADTVYLVWADGHLQRFDARIIDAPVLAESIELVGVKGASLTALEFMIGKATLVAGDSLGRVRTWFRVRPEQARTVDGTTLVLSHDLPGQGAPVTALSPSLRSRMLAAGYDDGTLRVFHVTSDQLLVQTEPSGSPAVTALAMTPKDDAVVSAGGAMITRWQVRPGHPEATLATLFTPVWYEGYSQPRHVWQSSGATDDFEPKYGLYPLIFGTLKATVYSMLFGVPLALLAAVYTSEFMHPRIKSTVKPTIEMMASLPSVVLGFLAALVFAPFVENVVPHILTAFVTLPVAFLLGAYLWQMLPKNLHTRLARFRLLIYLATLPIGLLMAAWLGPLVEAWFFAGDIKGWLTGRLGTGTGGWMVLFLPLSAIGVGIAFARMLNPYLRSYSAGWSHRKLATVDLIKFLGGILLTLGFSLTLAGLLTLAGIDPRGGFVDTYVQRNALVVGFVMGFAIIPIIYTISEDALSAVPEHLRAASLGCGATPWQTAIRIIIPTATSGLFSAVMIGLGRAVGETMIVLMAAGNTPVLDWNIFNGFRTLSANIAVELPEAVQFSTHYRTLFLAALTLFLMTFVINTAAETVRLRFRRKAFEL